MLMFFASKNYDFDWYINIITFDEMHSCKLLLIQASLC